MATVNLFKHEEAIVSFINPILVDLKGLSSLLTMLKINAFGSTTHCKEAQNMCSNFILIFYLIFFIKSFI